MGNQWSESVSYDTEGRVYKEWAEEMVTATDPQCAQTWRSTPWEDEKTVWEVYVLKTEAPVGKMCWGLFAYPKKMKAFWKKMAIPGYMIDFSAGGQI